MALKLNEEEKEIYLDMLTKERLGLIHKILEHALDFQRQELLSSRVVDSKSGEVVVFAKSRLDGAQKLVNDFKKITNP